MPQLPDYPVKSAFSSIEEIIRRNRSLALEAPTGSGKTTLLPILLLQSGLSQKKIILTQPRRLAAKSAAERISSLLGSPPGKLAGYRVRGESKVSAETRIEVVTEGYALAMLQADPYLSGYDWVLLDEFHERHIEGDLLLAFLRDLNSSVGESDAPGTILMTATWQGQPCEQLKEFSFHRIEGRLFPVEHRLFEGSSDTPLQNRLGAAVANALKSTDGKLLIFLPGRRELLDSLRLLKPLYPAAEFSLLHGGLELNEQQKVLLYNGPDRQIILATAIAETSLTIEGVTAVIDAGFQRMPVYQPAQGITRLVTRRVSRAAAEQRAGRAGRLGPGICYRLWNRTEDMELVERWDPEILAGDLSRARLQTAVWGTDSLPWITAPPAGPWAQAEELLRELDALNGEGLVTGRGKTLASLPLHPRLGHMVTAAPDTKHAAMAAAVISEGHRFRNGADAATFSDRLAAAETRSDLAFLRHEADDIVRQTAKRGGAPQPDAALSTGALLSLAYPDRIGRRKSPGTYVLTTGADIRCSEIDSEWAVFAEITGEPGRQHGRLAEPLDFDEASRLHSKMLSVSRETVYNPDSGGFKLVLAQLFGKIVIKNLPADVPSTEEKLNALETAVKKHGFSVLPLGRRAEQLLDKLEFAQRAGIGGLPTGNRERLAGTITEWLGPFLSERLNKELIFEALESRLDWAGKQRLEGLFPRRIELRPGQTKAVDYSNPERPLIRGRMQEFYGLTGPLTIAEGRISLAVELLSPAMRPLQTTSDLGTFWAGSYAQIRAEMRGRYPKHYWPESPADAEPSLSTGKRRPEG